MEKVVELDPPLFGSPLANRLVDAVDSLRAQAFNRSNLPRRSGIGQFPTPAIIARQMASMFEAAPKSIRLLDAGAGVGSLTAATLAELCQRRIKPNRID